jgi:hypothetical protein
VVLGGDLDGVLQCVDEAGEIIDLLDDAAEPLRRRQALERRGVQRVHDESPEKMARPR